MDAMLRQESEIPSPDPRLFIALHAATRSSHVALATEPALAYCGLKLTQAKSKRRAVDRYKPLEGICQACVEAVAKVEQLRAESALGGGPI